MRAMTEGFDVAQICENGHHTNWQTLDEPLKNVEHCPKCGAATITSCKNCGEEIRGCRYIAGAYGVRHESFPSNAPAFCHKCGGPYPWTEVGLEAAHDLANQLGLDIPERTLLDTSIEELFRNSPRAPAEAVRFKNIVERAKPWGLEAFKQVLGGVVGEAAKRLIWGE
jgi:hypothetical protein